MNKYKVSKIYSEEIVEVINVSMIASKGVADGKNLPVVFIDTSKRLDVREAILNHRYVATGDVITQWGRLSKKDYNNIYLIVEMKRPVECKFTIHFLTEKHGHIIDMIIFNGGFYLQSAEDGKKVVEALNVPRILIEVTTRSFKEEWDEIYHKVIVEVLKRTRKLSSKEACQQADDIINNIRRIRNFRMK